MKGNLVKNKSKIWNIKNKHILKLFSRNLILSLILYFFVHN